MIKLLESGCREKLPQHNKGHIWKTHNSITYPWLLYMILYFLKYLPLGHILYSLRTFYLFTVVFYTSNLIITGSYFRLLEDPGPIQDSFNPYDLHLDSTSATHVYSSIINWKFYNFELKCPTSWPQASIFQLFPHLISDSCLKYPRFQKHFQHLPLTLKLYLELIVLYHVFLPSFSLSLAPKTDYLFLYLCDMGNKQRFWSMLLK